MKKDIESIDLSQYKSVLISGGFNEKGELIVLPDIELLKKFKSFNLKINIHLGFFNKNHREVLNKIKYYIDAVSYNFLPDNKAISHISNKIYEDDYIISMSIYKKLGFRIYPHILIGLTDIDGEIKIWKKLKEFEPEKIVILFKIPRNTYESPMNFERVKKSIDVFQRFFPVERLIIGCMRPGGIWRKTIDNYLKGISIYGIVNPAFNTENYKVIEECCVL